MAGLKLMLPLRKVEQEPILLLDNKKASPFGINPAIKKKRHSGRSEAESRNP